MPEFIDVEQNTDTWFNLRAGKLTSSSLSKVMAHLGKPFGDPAKKLASTIALERITGVPVASTYTNADMDRGHEQEPLARMLYEETTLCQVTNGGFFQTDTEGCSPDGLVGDDGVIEIKSAIPHIHYDRVRRQEVDSAYKWQCINTLRVTERAWLDFISYCPDYPEGKQLFIHRIQASYLGEDFRTISRRVMEFNVLVDQCTDLINNSRYTTEAA